MIETEHFKALTCPQMFKHFSFSGLMTRLLLTHLDSLGVKKITLINRSKPRLEALIVR